MGIPESQDKRALAGSSLVSTSVKDVGKRSVANAQPYDAYSSTPFHIPLCQLVFETLRYIQSLAVRVILVRTISRPFDNGNGIGYCTLAGMC